MRFNIVNELVATELLYLQVFRPNCINTFFNCTSNVNCNK